MRSIPSRVPVAGCRRGIYSEASVHLTRPFSKYGLKPGLQARGAFSNRPLRSPLCALHTLDLCCNFQSIPLIP
jgi:hypothetical protein